jgi:hypothetical protein
MNKMILVALTGSFAVATAVACSSSSSTAPAGATTDDAGEDSGSSSGAASSSSSSGAGIPDGAIMVTCMSASDCSSGEVCCGVLAGISFKTVCQMADCTPILGMPSQGCATDTECRTPGATCQTSAALAALGMPNAKVCTPSTTTSDSGTDAAPVTDAAPTVDAGDGG